MKAIVHTGCGSPDVFELKELDMAVVQDDDVLVRRHAAALHACDYFGRRGDPYSVPMSTGWLKPKDYFPGCSNSGQVEAVGKDVTRLQPGDEEFGEQ